MGVVMVVMVMVMVMVVPKPPARRETPPREAVGRAAKAAAERFKRPGSQ